MSGDVLYNSFEAFGKTLHASNEEGEAVVPTTLGLHLFVDVRKDDLDQPNNCEDERTEGEGTNVEEEGPGEALVEWGP